MAARSEGEGTVAGGAARQERRGRDDGETRPREQVFSGVCRPNCMYACHISAHVRDGKLVKLEPAPYPEEGYTGCCAKGLSYIERIYSPTRIKHPLRRVGERGSGAWQRVSWDEAVSEIAERFQAVIDEFGPQAIVFDTCSGNYGYVNGIYSPLARLACVMGALKPAVCYDYAAGHGIHRVLGTGDWNYCNEPNSVLDASLVVIWGTNPVFCAPHNWRWIQQAKEGGTRTVALDPIKSATAHRCDDYVPVTPGNDGYLALAMAQHVVEKGLVDEEFLREKTTAAFLVRRDTRKHVRLSDFASAFAAGNPPQDAFYVWDKAPGGLALADEARDPALEGTFALDDGSLVDTAYTLLKRELAHYSVARASELCGPAPETIEALAEEIATSRAVTVSITYGLDHYVNGYLSTWAVAILLALTGNFAKPGAGFTGMFLQPFALNFLGQWTEAPEPATLRSNLPSGLLPDIIATQTLEGRPFPVKAMLSYSSNPVGNYASQRAYLDKVLPNLDFWVVLDMELGDSARFADLVLPVTSWYESCDIRVAYNNPYTLFQEQAIEPLYESKPEYEIAGLIGRALGHERSFPADYGFDEWASLLFTNDAAREQGLTLERLRAEKVVRTSGEPGKPFVRGLSAPWPTESGRVQLYCENPAPRLDYGQDLSAREPREHVVHYREPAECGPNSPLRGKYPLVFLQEHSRFRVHTQWARTPALRELDPEPLAKVNGVDARARGVRDGDMVEVFNDRGHAVVRCLVDESIAPGVLSIPKGWQRDQFVAGGYQEMTQPAMDPYPSSFAYYDTRVDFRKWEG